MTVLWQYCDSTVTVLWQYCDSTDSIAQHNKLCQKRCAIPLRTHSRDTLLFHHADDSNEGYLHCKCSSLLCLTPLAYNAQCERCWEEKPSEKLQDKNLKIKKSSQQVRMPLKSSLIGVHPWEKKTGNVNLQWAPPSPNHNVAGSVWCCCHLSNIVIGERAPVS